MVKRWGTGSKGYGSNPETVRSQWDGTYGPFVTWSPTCSLFMLYLWKIACCFRLRLFRRIMSPLVQRSGPMQAKPPDPPDQFWGMLLFESLSAGVLAVGVGLTAVMLVVMLYAVLVWPLTFWDLANLGLERYASWTDTV